MVVRLANAPVSWGVSLPRTPQDPDWGLVLDAIAESGYEGTELGPLGYLPPDPQQLTAELRERKLDLAGGFIYAPLHDRTARDEITRDLHETCAILSAIGSRDLILMDAMNPMRMATAGQSEVAERLEPEVWVELVDTVRQLAEIAATEYGLRAAFHPHAGSYVEFADEIERFFAEIDGSKLSLCLDTGHAAYAGLDPVELVRQYGDRLTYLHLKDVDPAVLERAVAEQLGWDAAVEANIFCELGNGAVRFEDLVAELERLDFSGWATVEQDVIPGSNADPAEGARRNLRFLRGLGLGQDQGE